MVYFCNVYVSTYGNSGIFRTYRLYSGSSLTDLKMNVIEDLQAEWSDAEGLDELDTSLSLDHIDLAFNEAISGLIDNMSDIEDFTLDISNEYTDLSNAFKFYGEYMDSLDEDTGTYDDLEFYFEGDFVSGIKNVFEYLYFINYDYDVHVSTEYAKKISNILGN